jgi:TonB family protein
MHPTVHTAQVLPPRALLFLAIVALHVLLAYFLTSSLMRATIQILVPPIIAEVVPERERPAPRPAIVEPRLDTPRVLSVPPLVDDIELPPDSPSPMRVTESLPEPVPYVPEAPTSADPPPLRLVGRNTMPNTEDYYPAQEKRLGLEGAAVVRACVNEVGKLDGVPAVEESSGRPAFDNAAVRIARDGRYARAMRGDTPVTHCYRFRVTFSLNER